MSWLSPQTAGRAYSTLQTQNYWTEASRTIGTERDRATVTGIRGAVITSRADPATTVLIARATMSPIQDRCPGLPVSIRQCTDVSGRNGQIVREISPVGLEKVGRICQRAKS